MDGASELLRRIDLTNPMMSEIPVAIPNPKNIKINTAVNVLAQMKSPRLDAHPTLTTDIRAQIPETLQADMVAILSENEPTHEFFF
jgi:hypothetical protein